MIDDNHVTIGDILATHSTYVTTDNIHVTDSVTIDSIHVTNSI